MPHCPIFYTVVCRVYCPLHYSINSLTDWWTFREWAWLISIELHCPCAVGPQSKTSAREMDWNTFQSARGTTRKHFISGVHSGRPSGCRPIFNRWSVQISAGKNSYSNRRFSWTSFVRAGKCGAMVASFHILCNSSFVYHPTVWHCIVGLLLTS
jgi:hypothetical protein